MQLTPQQIGALKKWVSLEPGIKKGACPSVLVPESTFPCDICSWLFPAVSSDRRPGHACPCYRRGVKEVTKKVKEVIYEYE